MPLMNDLEQDQILESASFLCDKGYELINQSPNGFNFSNGNIQFTIFYERRQEASDISVKFLNENEVFSVGWLSRIMGKNKNIDIHQKFENILYLLYFIKTNYSKITDINSCKSAMQEAERLFQNRLR